MTGPGSASVGAQCLVQPSFVTDVDDGTVDDDTRSAESVIGSQATDVATCVGGCGGDPLLRTSLHTSREGVAGSQRATELLELRGGPPLTALRWLRCEQAVVEAREDIGLGGAVRRTGGERGVSRRNRQLIEDGYRVVDHLGLAVRSGLRKPRMVELLELSTDRTHEVLVDIDGRRRLWTAGHDGVALRGNRILHAGSGDRNRHR